MLRADRRHEAYQYIKGRGSASVAELAESLRVSVQTVRRDLDSLHEEGLVERVHGGAVAADGGDAAGIEHATLERAGEYLGEKKRIGKAAGRLVEPGSTIYLSGGTTTVHVVSHLETNARITVVTNALNIAQALSRRPDIETIVLGGYLRHSELTLLGPAAEQAIHEFRIDHALYGCFGIDPEEGLSGASVIETAMDHAVLAVVSRVTVLADHSKFSQRGPVRLAGVSRISRLVTDRAASEEGVRRLQERGLEVVLV